MITIIQATTAHAKGIHAVEQESFSDPWSLHSIENEINREDNICLVAIENSMVVGYVSMRCIFEEGHINNIAVVKAYRRLGVGSLLFETLVTKAKRCSVTALTLEVRVSNHAAISLYEKYGFKVEGYRKNYYEFPTEDAAIMWSNLNIYNLSKPPQGCEHKEHA